MIVVSFALVDLRNIPNVLMTVTHPLAPHFGGLWEAAVKSMKKHLAKIVGEVKLNFEELCDPQYCVRSKPASIADL